MDLSKPVTRGALIGATLALAVSTGSAQQVWTVDANGGGDFTDIPAAIAAAADGDRIVVDPANGFQYAAFTLNRGLVIRATSGHFNVDNIRIEDVPPGPPAAVSYAHVDEFVVVARCTNEVILEGLWFDSFYYDSSNLLIDRCTNVSVNDLKIEQLQFGGASIGLPTVHLKQSIVRMDRPDIEGATAAAGDAGEDALFVDRSHLALSSPQIQGGHGDVNTYISVDAGNGVVVKGNRSTVVIVGTSQDLIRGGDGGCDDEGGGGCARAGDGLVVLQGDVTVSRVTLEGGANGGQDEVGPVDHFDQLPVFDMPADLHLGGNYTLTLDAVQTGRVLLVFSDAGGFWKVPNTLGPQLSAVPGGAVFDIFALGRTDAAGQWSHGLGWNPDPSTLATTWTFQLAVLGDDGNTYLSNAITRTIGQ